MAGKKRKISFKLNPISLALGFGLAVAIEVYLLGNIAVNMFPSEQTAKGKFIVLATTIIPLWIFGYLIAGFITAKR